MVSRSNRRKMYGKQGRVFRNIQGLRGHQFATHPTEHADGTRGHGLCRQAETCDICKPQLRLVAQTLFSGLEHAAAWADVEDELDHIFEAFSDWSRAGMPGWPGPGGLGGAGNVSRDELARV